MTYNTKAIVLQSYSWPRAAKCFVLYTEKFGKVRAVAAGVQKVKSKVAGHLQPFVVSEVMIAKGRNIDKIAQARIETHFSVFVENSDSYFLGTYILEVLNRLTREGIVDQHIWQDLQEVLQEFQSQGLWGVDSSQQRFALLSRIFALKILLHIGYKPELDTCVDCGKDIQKDNFLFSLLGGGLICLVCAQAEPALSISEGAVKILRTALNNNIADAIRVIGSQIDNDNAMLVIDQMVTMYTHQPIKTLALISN